MTTPTPLYNIIVCHAHLPSTLPCRLVVHVTPIKLILSHHSHCLLAGDTIYVVIAIMLYNRTIFNIAPCNFPLQQIKVTTPPESLH